MISCIHFIRHGITEGIQNKWYYGATDMPLVEEGIEELKNLMAQGIYPPLGDADCYTSGMTRANQTFETIYGDTKYRVLPKLQEMSFGQWECKTFDELKELEGFETWINDQTGSFVFPGGDSAMSFYERVADGLEELRGYHHLKEQVYRPSGDDAVTIMVCHGGVIAACMCALFGIPAADFWKWIPAPGRGYTAFFENGEPVRYEKI